MRALLIVCLFGVLFLTSCSKQTAQGVYNRTGVLIGSLRPLSEGGTAILDPFGKVQGKIEGDVVSATGDEQIGRIVSRDSEQSVLDKDGIEIGTLQNKTDCYGKDETFLGKVNGVADERAAAGACLVLLLSNQPK